ncbi:MAG: hypothetical protein GZ094_06255 [Mariniphaga sp.]|nr:hypothetical protein [Mariniphaga sp.]
MIREIAYKIVLLLFSIIILASASFAQSSKYLPNKPGKWTYYSNIKSPGTEVAAFNKNLAVLAEWFHLNVPILTNPKGFDVLTTSFGIWDDKYKLQACNYGLRSELNFDFQLFLSDLARGGKWVIEPPHYSFYINNTETGHGTNSNFLGWDNTKDPQSLEAAMDKAAAGLNDLFRIFPLVRDIAPGVKLYGDGNLIVFNPNRPPFWIPVTVKEIMEVKLAYYKVKHEIDSINYEKMLASWAKMNFNPDPEHTMRPQLYQMIKQEFENFTTEELNSPAYSDASDENGISSINAQGNGRAVVRFNPDCWDRSLPVTAVQFMSLQYRPATEQERDEFKPRNKGLEDFVGKFFNKLPVGKMGILIDKK